MSELSQFAEPETLPYKRFIVPVVIISRRSKRKWYETRVVMAQTELSAKRLAASMTRDWNARELFRVKVVK